ncbi:MULTISPECIES: hypothetical protein [Bacillaceae]|jgi:hypothetical protein|uniref:Uncharacterized protein n=1 Tax=Parageobacillus galactosidasius TaxID=883812 RepID=A0A226QGR1_9BACL|nr:MULTISPECIES: hypothetical protein [Bacillaceae]ASS85978.1 hypothetical protein GLN3_01825 [Geobacillus lituanicus]EPR28122.1 hypothetical protein I656_02222 [Geobacillus sp. WSUCF1]MED4877981.1 hypothetical protein [Anoxybacillus geothermalis]OQO98899.1 hypothetical protein B1689_15115 [Geobacillus sp. 44C]AMQ20538.1 hypothetical protein A0V43_05835 [Geobacillus sp. JS12]
MRASQEFIKKLEELYQIYENEVKEKWKEGLLADDTAKTYLCHSRNFVKWCRNEFVPGGRNEKK